MEDIQREQKAYVLLEEKVEQQAALVEQAHEGSKQQIEATHKVPQSEDSAVLCCECR